MKKKLLLLVSLTVAVSTMAQPYVDPMNIRYTKAFSNGAKNGTPFSHLYIGPDLPFKMKKNKFIVLSPFFEKWNIDSASNKNYLPRLVP
jgi:hypothetical protein